MNMNIRVIDCNPIVGFVDYGTIECDTNNIYSGLGTKMRCKKCGHAWLSENEVAGTDTCPKCFATGRDVIMWGCYHV